MFKEVSLNHVTCPMCEGTKEVPGTFGMIDCFFCNSSGQVPICPVCGNWMEWWRKSWFCGKCYEDEEDAQDVRV